MEEYLAVCREITENKIDNYLQIRYDDFNLWMPVELVDQSVSITLNPWPSDLPNRELLVVINEKN